MKTWQNEKLHRFRWMKQNLNDDCSSGFQGHDRCHDNRVTHGRFGMILHKLTHCSNTVHEQPEHQNVTGSTAERRSAQWVRGSKVTKTTTDTFYWSVDITPKFQNRYKNSWSYNLVLNTWKSSWQEQQIKNSVGLYSWLQEVLKLICDGPQTLPDEGLRTETSPHLSLFDKYSHVFLHILFIQQKKVKLSEHKQLKKKFEEILHSLKLFRFKSGTHQQKVQDYKSDQRVHANTLDQYLVLWLSTFWYQLSAMNTWSYELPFDNDPFLWTPALFQLGATYTLNN